MLRESGDWVPPHKRSQTGLRTSIDINNIVQRHHVVLVFLVFTNFEEGKARIRSEVQIETSHGTRTR